MFMPNDYTEAEAVDRYVRLVQGTQTFRIVSSLEKDGSNNNTHIWGYVGWWKHDPEDIKEKAKVERWPHGESAPDKPWTDHVKPFVALTVYEYASNTCKLWDIPQKTIRDDLASFYRDEVWGDLRGYDVDVIRSGEEKQTRYKVIPKPKAKLTDEARAIVLETLPLINVAALFTGGLPP